MLDVTTNAHCLLLLSVELGLGHTFYWPLLSCCLGLPVNKLVFVAASLILEWSAGNVQVIVFNFMPWKVSSTPFYALNLYWRNRTPAPIQLATSSSFVCFLEAAEFLFRASTVSGLKGCISGTLWEIDAIEYFLNNSFALILLGRVEKWCQIDLGGKERESLRPSRAQLQGS